MVDRMERINSQVQVIISRFFSENRDRFAPYFLTITNVEVSRDLQHAKVFIGVIGKIIDEKKLKVSLEHSRRDLQTEIGNKVTFKFTPIVEFIIDHSGEEARKIEKILRETKK
jgi:ribosome-binding factor A